MNANQIINMVMRMLGRRLINGGINKGIDLAAGRGKPAAEMTPEEHAQATQARQLAKRARQAARITRRLGR
jgi:hypothetical protein